MTFRFDERPNTFRTATNPPSVDQQYVAAGELNSAIVRAYAASATPYMIASDSDILFRDDIQLQHQGGGVYYVTVRWVKQDEQKPPVGQWKFSFSTTGGTFHISHSRETVAKYPSTAPSYEQAINVVKKDNDADIEGADIIVPATKLTYTYSHPLGVVNESFARSIADLTGGVNSATWRGFDAGSLIFLGAEGSDGSNSEAEVNYHFAYERNLENLTYGSITGVNKDGHDLLWVEKKLDTVGGKPVVKVLAVRVERCYQRFNFAAALGWG